MARLVETLRYKSVGRWFDWRWGHRDFSLTLFMEVKRRTTPNMMLSLS